MRTQIQNLIKNEPGLAKKYRKFRKNTSLIPQLSLDKKNSSGPQTNSFEQKDNKDEKNSPLIPELGFEKIFQESQKIALKKWRFRQIKKQ